ncbi:hypothetical protein M011DRAFT_38086 [Sporormia fimetaria CBS 119925]|uniref:Uncharacterized protein n=1 Tax=Sporormia fimetaria CBS 119925 TaxID=1340428 RepID=A0A6A6VEZ1_9PLEO|nr:hypothetical protein M011DRAFT_38086 [Sporormia fimetaria CBS 119925]
MVFLLHQVSGSSRSRGSRQFSAPDVKETTVMEIDESGLAREATYDFLPLFDARFDLGNVPGRVIVEGSGLELILTENRQVLLGRQLALAKALLRNALCHDVQSTALAEAADAEIFARAAVRTGCADDSPEGGLHGALRRPRLLQRRLAGVEKDGASDAVSAGRAENCRNRDFRFRGDESCRFRYLQRIFRWVVGWLGDGNAVAVVGLCCRDGGSGALGFRERWCAASSGFVVGAEDWSRACR